MDAEAIKEIKRLAAAATPGDWATEQYHEFTTTEHTEIYTELLEQGLYDQAGRRPLVECVEAMIGGTHRTICLVGNGPTSAANAEYIAATDPDTLLSLIDTIERQQTAIAAAHAALRSIVDTDEAPPILRTIGEALRALETALEEVTL